MISDKKRCAGDGGKYRQSYAQCCARVLPIEECKFNPILLISLGFILVNCNRANNCVNFYFNLNYNYEMLALVSNAFYFPLNGTFFCTFKLLVTIGFCIFVRLLITRLN